MSYVATLQTSSQTESACNTTPKMYKSHNIMSLLRDMKLMSHDRIFCRASVDLTGVFRWRATLFECLRHNLLRCRSNFWLLGSEDRGGSDNSI